MECNSKLYCTMDPLVLSSFRQQLNWRMEKGMKPTQKAGCQWTLKKKLLQFYKVIFFVVVKYCIVLHCS